jgi:hypothetical protein
MFIALILCNAKAEIILALVDMGNDFQCPRQLAQETVFDGDCG